MMVGGYHLLHCLIGLTGHTQSTTIMMNGRLELRVRSAMANYLRARLNLPLADGSRPNPQLELGV